MKLKELVEKLGLEVIFAGNAIEKEIKRGYASDLLSDVLANAQEGDLWITLQVHPNIVAVASMKGLAAIVMIGGRQPEEETIKKAESEDMAIITTEVSAFELIGKLYSLGISGQ